jgi:hypothetical protein
VLKGHKPGGLRNYRQGRHLPVAQNFATPPASNPAAGKGA